MKKFFLPKGVTEPAGSNSPFGPLSITTEQNFWKEVSVWGLGADVPHSYRYGQVWASYLPIDQPPNDRIVALHYIWYAHYGYAIAIDQLVGLNTRIYIPQFYYIGCTHKWVEKPSNMRSYHILECSICGADNQYDSGD